MKVNRIDVRQEFFPIVNVRVIDGDCIEATILLAFGACVIKRIRLKGFWAPELDGRRAHDGLLAQHRLEDWCLTRDLFIRCPSGRTDRYGRVLADLWSSAGPADPRAILGDLQMSEVDHRVELDLIRRNAGMFVSPEYLQEIGELKPRGDGAAQ